MVLLAFFGIGMGFFWLLEKRRRSKMARLPQDEQSNDKPWF